MNDETIVTLAIIILCVLAEGFFSGSEMAIVSSNWLRIRREAERGDRRARLLELMWRNPDRLLATTLVGTNVSLITASVMATYLMLRLTETFLGSVPYLAGREEILVTLLLVPNTLLFGEIMPKTIFQSRADRIAKRCVYPMILAWIAFYPITMVLAFLSGMVKKSVGQRLATSPFVTRDELSMIVKMRDLKTGLKMHEKRMIRRLFGFRETKVREVMVPLVRMAALEEGMTLKKALKVFNRTRHTRYPVFRDRVVNIVGVLNVLKCLHEPDPGRRIQPLVDPPHFVPESKSVVDLLHEMERENIRMAIVVDEYGGTVGIVTVEDVLEEIVGELEDEYQIKKKAMRKIDGNRYEVDAHLETEFIAEKLGLSFASGNFETLAGLMIDRLGHIPRQGEEVRLESGMILRAEQVDKRTVEKIVIILPGD